jgi:hypothetical protein
MALVLEKLLSKQKCNVNPYSRDYGLSPGKEILAG